MKLFKPLTGGLLVAIVFLLNAMAASPALHELIHKDAEGPTHSCAATLFAHGHVESTACDVPVVLPTTFVETTPHFEFFVFSTAIENLPPGRAPPTAVRTGVIGNKQTGVMGYSSEHYVLENCEPYGRDYSICDVGAERALYGERTVRAVRHQPQDRL